MAERDITGMPMTVRVPTGVQRTGSATDRRPRRQEKDGKRQGEPGGQGRLKRHLYDLLYSEIDQVEELESHQRDRLKRNIASYLALQARYRDAVGGYGSSPPYAGSPQRPATPPPSPSQSGSPDDHEHDGGEDIDQEGKPDGEAPSEDAASDQLPLDPADETDPRHHQKLIDVAAPLDADLPAAELEQNAILAFQLRDCLSRHDHVASKIAVYLHLLLGIDGVLAPHFIVEI